MEANDGEELSATVLLPPRFSLKNNLDEFSLRTTDSADSEESKQGRELRSSSRVSIQLQPDGGDLSHVVFVSYRLDGLDQDNNENQPIVSVFPLSSRGKIIKNTQVSTIMMTSIVKVSLKVLYFQVKPQVKLELPTEIGLEFSCHSWARSASNCFVAPASNECVCSRFSRYVLNSTEVTTGTGSGIDQYYNSPVAEQPDLPELPSILENSNKNSRLENETTAFVIVVAVASALLVASVLGVALVVIYCRRVKVSEFRAFSSFSDL